MISQFEVARRLLNTSPVLVSEGLTEEQLDKFCYKLMVSGYNQREREIILKEGNARYRNLCELVEKGVRPLPDDIRGGNISPGKTTYTIYDLTK